VAPPIDGEPFPRLDRKADGPSWPEARVVHRFGSPLPAQPRDFHEVVGARRSRSGGDLPLGRLGEILWHATRLRERRSDGRFGGWESRSAPSAGGIHGLRFVLLPMGNEAPAGLHDPDSHAILGIENAARAGQIAAGLLRDMALPQNGWFAQVIVDMPAYRSRYDHSASLILRDVGALCYAVTLVAEAVGACSRILGHLDSGIVNALELGPRYAGAGGLHLTGTHPGVS